MIRSLMRLIYSCDVVLDLRNKGILSNNGVSEYRFLFTRLIVCILLFIGLLLLGDYGYIFAPITVIIIYNLWRYMLYDKKIKERIISLENDSILFFEAISIALKSGKSIMDSILISCESIDGDLSDEFYKSYEDIKNGKNIKESLKSLEARIPSIKIRSIIELFIQANKLGSDIIESLDYQIDDIRDNNFIILKSKMDKIPVYVGIASALLFFPVIVLLVFAPKIIELIS